MIERHVRAIDRITLLEHAPQGTNIHVRRHARIVGHQTSHRHIDKRPRALKHLDAQLIPHPHTKHLGKFFRHHHALRRQHDRLVIAIEQTVQIRAGRDPGDRKFPLAMTILQTRRHTADRFGADHSGQMLEVMPTTRRCGIGQKHRDILPLLAVPLKGEQIINAVAHRSRQHHQTRRKRKPAACENRLPRTALDVAQGHAEGRTEKSRQPHALEKRGLEVRRRLGPHRLGRRQLHRLPHHREHAQHRGPHAYCER